MQANKKERHIIISNILILASSLLKSTQESSAEKFSLDKIKEKQFSDCQWSFSKTKNKKIWRRHKLAARRRIIPAESKLLFM